MGVGRSGYVYYKRTSPLPKHCKPGITTFNNSIATVINRACVYVIRNELLSCSFNFKLVSTDCKTLLLLLSHCGPSLSQGSSTIKCTLKGRFHY